MGVSLYVDGSFSPVLQKYGSGVVVAVNGEVKKTFSIPGTEPEFNKYNNVSGEVFATMLGTMWVQQNMPGLEELDIYYDYQGIELWVTGRWSANNTLSQYYKDHMKGLPFKVTFHHVYSHTGDPLNSLADSLARKAVGLS